MDEPGPPWLVPGLPGRGAVLPTDEPGPLWLVPELPGWEAVLPPGCAQVESLLRPAGETGL
jgi:hypothetical protein